MFRASCTRPARIPVFGSPSPPFRHHRHAAPVSHVQHSSIGKHIANYAIAAMNVEKAAETARLLRDFDRSGTDFTDRILEFWSSNREMMRAVISDV